MTAEIVQDVLHEKILKSALGGAARDAEEGRVADSAPHLGISQISYSPFPAMFSIGLNSHHFANSSF